jgi:hypothetical protein
VNRRLTLLSVGCLAFGVLTAFPAAQLWGPAMYVDAAVACGLCLLPTLAACAAADRAFRNSPQRQVLAFLGGSGLRMLVVLSAGLVLYLLVPYFKDQGAVLFWGWLLVFYLFTLGVEVALLLQPSKPTN